MEKTSIFSDGQQDTQEIQRFKPIIRSCTVKEILLDTNIEKILSEYSEETLAQGYPKPKVRYDVYKAMEDAGGLSLVGSFIDNKLIGFITVLTSMLPHFSKTITVSESFFVLKEYRSTGVGLKLLREAERIAKIKDSYALIISAPLNSVLGEVLPRVGYKPTAQIFFKGLSK